MNTDIQMIKSDFIYINLCSSVDNFLPNYILFIIIFEL
jgi:hypothetical protein